MCREWYWWEKRRLEEWFGVEKCHGVCKSGMDWRAGKKTRERISEIRDQRRQKESGDGWKVNGTGAAGVAMEPHDACITSCATNEGTRRACSVFFGRALTLTQHPASPMRRNARLPGLPCGREVASLASVKQVQGPRDQRKQLVSWMLDAGCWMRCRDKLAHSVLRSRNL
jgi:hypothetical protein